MPVDVEKSHEELGLSRIQAPTQTPNSKRG
jgi:hypothetical protein